MNTALIIAYDDTDAVIQKRRTMDDHDAIWSIVVEWLTDTDTAKITVERFDPQDIEVQCYEVALVA